MCGTAGRGRGGLLPFAEPGVEPHYAPSRTTRIQHYDLSLSFDLQAKHFDGVARIELTALPTYDGYVKLDLDDVIVDAVRDGDGNDLPWVHEHDELVIEADQPTVVEVRWHGDDPRRGLYFVGATSSAPDRRPQAWTQCQDEDGHFVFPCHDHPGTKHSWSVRLEGPAGFHLLSNGKQVESGETDGRAWARYVQEEPMPAYLFTAVCAELSVIEASWKDVPVRYLVPVGFEEAVARSMGKTPLMIEHFSERTGVDYPWPRYDQVVVWDFIFGGMENTGCTTMTDLLLVDDKAVLDWDPDGLVAHELAHQWFGDLVTCQDWSQGWLNESWATFMEAVWWEADRDDDEAIWYRWTTQSEYLDEYQGRYRRPLVAYHFREPIDVFDRTLYQKGSCVLWTLRGVVGEAPFWGGVSAYLKANAHDNVHSHDFQRALEKSTGMNLDRFFKQWVHGIGHPELKLQLSTGDNTLELQIEQTQQGDDIAEAFAFQLPIEVVTADGTQSHRIPVTKRKQLFVLPATGVKTVRIDPGLTILSTHTWKAPRGWLIEGLADVDPVIAVRSASALLEEGSLQSVEAVRKAMTVHPFWGVRAALAGKLGKRGTPSDRDALAELLELDSDPRTRRAAAAALGSFRDEAAADALIAVIEEPVSTWHLLGSALKALGATRDARATDVLRSKLDQDSWGEVVRTRALAGLAATRDASVLDTLLRHTRADQHDRVRSAAAGALGSLGDTTPEVKDAVLERLVEMLAEPGFRAQLGAIAALETLRDPRAAGPLNRVHRSAPDGRTRRAAYEAVQGIKKGRTGEEALQSLRADLEKVREAHAELLERVERLESTNEA